jgi:hypothetical protein
MLQSHRHLFSPVGTTSCVKHTRDLGGERVASSPSNFKLRRFRKAAAASAHKVRHCTVRTLVPGRKFIGTNHRAARIASVALLDGTGPRGPRRSGRKTPLAIFAQAPTAVCGNSCHCNARDTDRCGDIPISICTWSRLIAPALMPPCATSRMNA